MPIVELNTTTVTIPTARLGVNLYSSMYDTAMEECLYSKNMIYRRGMVTRNGCSLLAVSPVVNGVFKVLGLHRFYNSTANQTLAAANTTIARMSGTGWVAVDTTRTANNSTFFETWLGKVYIANGVDAPITWDTSSVGTLAAFPTKTTQTLAFQDRLLILSNNNLGSLQWSGAYDPTTVETVSACGVRPDYKLNGMIIHAANITVGGQASAVLLAGSNGMYLFRGTDLRTPFTVGNYTIVPLATKVGCASPRTMVWTPKGSMYLGSDKQVYLLPFDSLTPIPVSHKVFSTDTTIPSIESIPDAYLANACAAYYDGFYMLSYTPRGKTVNSEQVWLDVHRLAVDDKGLFGPWYGPMTGASVTCFALANAEGDGNTLYAGSDSDNQAFVYKWALSGVYADNIQARFYGQDYYGDRYYGESTAQPIVTTYQTALHPLSNESLQKDIHHIEVTLQDDSDTIDISLMDGGVLKASGLNFINSAPLAYYGEQYYGAGYYTSPTPTRHLLNVSPAIGCRYLSIKFDKASGVERTEIHRILVAATEQSAIFA